jgi:hypothetical protein
MEEGRKRYREKEKKRRAMIVSDGKKSLVRCNRVGGTEHCTCTPHIPHTTYAHSTCHTSGWEDRVTERRREGKIQEKREKEKEL